MFAAGVYSLLRRSLIRMLLGFNLIGHAANLLVFFSGDMGGAPPVIPSGQGALPPGFADPLPQALVLTAIVIGFGLTGFLTALVVRADRETGTEDSEALPGGSP
jgi:multicomponent Na+:H+ antiporter subunit C